MPVKIGKKLYATVQERLTAAHGDAILPEGIASIISDVRPAGEAVVVISTVTFTDGRAFTGISQARFDATSGADATNPLECAETSAVGRALAMAGYFGTDDGLAGAEEVRAAQRVQTGRPPQTAPHSAPQNKPRMEDLEFSKTPEGRMTAALTWYEANREEAKRLGYTPVVFADDAPAEYVIGEADKMLAHIRQAKQAGSK